MKRILLVVSMLLISSVLAMGFGCAKPAPAPAPAAPAPAPQEKVHWDVSVWGGPRTMTGPIENWRDEMARLTNGLWEIEIHYGAVLAKPIDNLDGVKEGLFHVGVSMAFYHPGKTPLLTVFDLPFITPGNAEDIMRLSIALGEHPAVTEELAKWNSMVLFNLLVEQYDLVGNKRIAKVEDLKGARIRVSPGMGAPLVKFGAVQVMMPIGDVYTALDTGTIDLAGFPLGTMGDWKFYEVSKYVTTGISMGSAFQFFFGSIDAWNALPDEWKKFHNDFRAKEQMAFAKSRTTATASFVPTLKDKGMEIIQFPPAERAKLVAYAEEAWEKWVTDMEGKGLPGKELLDFLIAKSKEITGK